MVLTVGDITFKFDDKRGYPTDAGIVWTDVHANNPSFGESTLTFEAFDASGYHTSPNEGVFISTVEKNCNLISFEELKAGDFLTFGFIT